MATAPDSRSAERGRAGSCAPAVTPSNFLAQLNAGDREALQRISVTQKYPRGNLVFTAGSADANVYFLRDGKIKIKQLSPEGREVILWFCLPGEIFGLAEVTRGGGRIVTAQACEASTVMAVPQVKFRAYLEQHPTVALLSLQVLSSRLRVLGEMVVNLVSDDVNTRIAKLILRLSARYGTRANGEVLLNLPLTHQEIADMVGTTRQTVTTTLGALKRRGVLSIDAHRIRIEREELLNDLTSPT